MAVSHLDNRRLKYAVKIRRPLRVLVALMGALSQCLARQRGAGRSPRLLFLWALGRGENAL